MLSTTRWLLGVLLAGTCPAVAWAEDRPPGQTLTREQLAGAEDAAGQLVRNLDELQAAAVDELTGPRERTLYRQTDAVLAEALAFEEALKSGRRQDLYERFDRMDGKLHLLLESVRSLGGGHRVLARTARYLRATDDQLHYALSAGDTSPERTRQSVQRQARALAAAARELKQTANYALGEVPGRGVLLGDVDRLAETAVEFSQALARGRSPAELRDAFAPINRAWDRVVGGLKKLPAGENVYLLRSAGRLDRLHERLHGLLGVKEERPRLIIRS